MRRRFKISVDGREYDVAVTEVVDDPGNLYPDRGSMDPAGVQLGRPAAPAAAAAEKTEHAAGPGDVVSPLAGIVASLDVALGVEVEENTRVVTLEAMKTKTFVGAGRSGKVSAIAVSVGESVEAGQALLTIA